MAQVCFSFSDSAFFIFRELNQFDIAGMTFVLIFNYFEAKVIYLTDAVATFVLSVTSDTIVLILGRLPIFCIFFHFIGVPAFVSFFRDGN